MNAGTSESPANDASVTEPETSVENPVEGDASTARIEHLEAELAEAKAKAAEHFDALLRAKAETDNARRRAQEDVSKAHKFGIENFAESLLPVMDSLQAALADTTTDGAKVREGVELTRKQLSAAFERNRLVPIDPVGEKFDPHRHQSVAAVPADGVAPNHVVSVLQKGWMIADRVLRPALVTVAN